MRTRLLTILIPLLIYSCSENVIQTSVFTDDFNQLDSAIVPLSEGGDEAIYFKEGRGVVGQWRIATSLRQEGFNEAWQVRKSIDGTSLVQTFINLDQQNEPLSLTTHPIIITGDSMWNDCKIEVDFTPMAKFDKCGVVFGYQHPNEFYFFGTEGNTVILKHISQPVTPLRPIERILEYKPLVWTPGEEMHAVVTIRRNKISTILNDSIRMYEENETILPGRIGLISDMPAVFNRVEVKMLKGELRKLNRKKRQFARREEIHIERHPKMVRWKSYDTRSFGTDQNIRLGDLTRDGNKEILFARADVTGNSVCFITAMNLDGKMIWQYGDTLMALKESGRELPIQIHDLDGDGEREVIFIAQGWIHILEGHSGKLLQRVKLSRVMEPRSVQFGDFLRTGRDNCILLSDHESGLILLNEKLQILWQRDLKEGSQPLIYDLDGDGYDEVLAGYSVFNHEGSLMFNSGEFIGDRCNGVTVSELFHGELSRPCLLYAAGDWGVMYVDFEGQVMKQNIIGHVNYLSVADFDFETPGPELVTSNGWGSDGLVHISDASGKVRQLFTASAGVSRCAPVNWKGDGEEFFIISADSLSGGLFDKYGELSVRFPTDGHPATCYHVTDLTGDSRDELLVWNREKLWIYTQDDNPRMGRTYNPDRIPLYNHSLQHMNLSQPGW
ncbi:MAG: hypothetical protein R6W31_09850 [Bacteroidales bacterium]